MSLQTSRRHFLTVASATGLLAATAPPLQALRSEESEGPVLEFQGRHRVGTVTALQSGDLDVQVEDSVEPLRVTPRYFGEWQYQIGDRVLVVEEPDDSPVAEPLVVPVDAPLPDRVELGLVIRLGEITARVDSRKVVERAREIRHRDAPDPSHWLLIENTQTGEYRVFGVVNRHGSTPHPHP
jgi:hypothetical protein